MSWSVFLCAKRGYAIECGNYTYNVAPMYEKAGIPGGSLNDLDATPAKRMAEILEPAIKYMEEHPSEMLALEPSNGWGHYSGALSFLREIYSACRKYPRRTVCVS